MSTNKSVIERVDHRFKIWLDNYHKQFSNLGYNFSRRELTSMLPYLVRWSDVRKIPPATFKKIVKKKNKDRGGIFW